MNMGRLVMSEGFRDALVEESWNRFGGANLHFYTVEGELEIPTVFMYIK